MKKLTLFLLLVVISFTAFSAGQSADAQSESPEPLLKMVTIKAESPGAVRKLARMGIDIAAGLKGPVHRSAHQEVGTIKLLSHRTHRRTVNMVIVGSAIKNAHATP